MKAMLVEQDIYDGLGNPGMPRRPSGKVRRLVVGEPIGVAITIINKNVIACKGSNVLGCTILGEVEVPDELIARAMCLIMDQEKLNAQMDTFAALMR